MSPDHRQNAEQFLCGPGQARHVDTSRSHPGHKNWQVGQTWHRSALWSESVSSKEANDLVEFIERLSTRSSDRLEGFGSAQ